LQSPAGLKDDPVKQPLLAQTGLVLVGLEHLIIYCNAPQAEGRPREEAVLAQAGEPRRAAH
jgi:hypothetical protein